MTLLYGILAMLGAMIAVPLLAWVVWHTVDDALHKHYTGERKKHG